VVRGEDLLPSSLAQHFLASTLGQPSFNEITFYHHPLIVGPTGDKLSKSAGDTSVHYLRKDHKTPADIFAMTAAMLGLKGNPTSWQELIALTNLAI
jgi:glutamyl-tRNA synthetase